MIGRKLLYGVFCVCWLVLWLVGDVTQGYAQGAGLEDKLVLHEENDFLICNDEGKQFRTTVTNETPAGIFQDGTYEVDFGNGTVKSNLSMSSFPLLLTYTESKEYILKFSAIAISTGTKVTKEYKVRALGRPVIDLRKVDENAQCIGSDVIYLVEVADKNTPGTTYTMNYDDGTEPEVLTNDQLKNQNQRFVHRYDHSYCDREHMGSSHEQFEVKLTVRNECNYSDFKIISEHVVTPLDAKFTFDKKKNCTYEKVRLRNLTTGGGNSDCSGGNIFWEWYYGDGKESNAFEPEITFEEAGNYPIKLIATNNYSCANDTATEEVVLIDRVKALFKIADDTLCSGETLEFKNLSTGDELRPFRWQIFPEDGGTPPTIVNGNFTVTDPQIRFDHYGRYRVSLTVTNDCSESVMDTTIIVREDPGILKFDLPATICPPRLNLSDYVRFSWNGNEVKPVWTITRDGSGETGYTYAGGTGKNSEFPQIDFTLPGDYTLKVQLTSVGCGGTVLEKSGRVKVYDPDLLMKVTTGNLDICEAGTVLFTSNSEGENIDHKWTVAPSANTSFAGGTVASDRTPLIRFDKYGDYVVRLNLKTHCTEKDSSFTVHVHKEPNIAHFEPQAAVCPEDVIDFHDCIIYQFWNNPEEAEWTITPTAGLEFLNGTDEHSTYPVIRFKTPGTYEFTVKLNPVSCSTEGVTQQLTRKVKVRNSAMTLKVSADDTAVCEAGRLSFSMTAAAAEDDPIVYNWTVWSDAPQADYAFEDYGNQKSVAKVLFNTWGTYWVRGEASGYCGTLDSTMTVTVKKDPEVHLRDTGGICPGTVRLEDYVSYEWYNNTPKVTWEIVPASSGTPTDGFGYSEGTGANSLYPVVDFRKKGDYQVRATLETAGCREEYLTALKLYTVFDTTILVDVRPLGATDICEGETVRFRNRSEGVGLVCHWQVEGPEGGWLFAEGTDAMTMAPVFQFSRYGDYVLTLVMEGTCNRKERKFPVKVRGIPDVVLTEQMAPICASSAAIDMGRYVEYRDLKNCDVTYYWSVNPGDGYEFVDGYGRDSQYPQISFTKNDRYTITLEVYSQCGTGGVQTFDARVNVLNNSLKAAFVLDSTVCIPANLVLDNRSEGDSLVYKWHVLPETVSGGGWEISGEGQDTARSPHLTFSEQGYYNVTLAVQNLCGTDDTTFRVRAFAVPEVTVADIAGVCEPFAFSARDRILVEGNNDRIHKAEWTITSAAVYDYFDKTALYPDVVFHAGEFQVNVKYWNRCAQPGEGNFSVVVDEFVPIQALRDTAVCVLTDPFLLKAQPDWGSWVSEEGEVLQKDGKYYFNPHFDAYYEGDIQVVYNLPNGTCLAKDTLTVHIHPLPRVDAGTDPEMCLNHAPLPLTGTPVAGHWESAGEVLPGDKYTPSTAGDFAVYYYYTDGNGCTNFDSVTLTVHPLPVTTFRTEAQHCRYAEALFMPDQPEGNRFEWDFGDAAPVVVSGGDTVHVYDGYGYYDVRNVTTSSHGCIDRSAPVRIEVVNLPPDAYFDVDRINGCAPFEAMFSVDPSRYPDDHNHLSFAWDYGDGTITDSLMPIRPKFYQEGLWDTSYIATFTVKNKCGVRTYDTLLTVNSYPIAGFELMHKWECSPVTLELQNTTTGNQCKFTWDFGDGAPVDHTPNAVHVFTTGGTSTKYHITLVAENKCGRSEHTDSLIVKPRSLSAHFTPAKPYACVDEVLCFKNNSTDTLGLVENTYWNFGDGDRDSLWDVCHSYAAAGKYQVQLYIENGCGFDTISDWIQVHPLPQLAILTSEHLCEADTFTFVVRSDQELKRVQWDFGDGSTGTKDSMRYVYAGYGHYHVAVTGIAASLPACRATVTKEVDVYNKPIVTILPLDTAHCSPLYYKPSVEAVGVNFFMWDFGDGSEPVSVGEHRYENETDEVQQYTVTANVETDKGCRSEYKRHVTVYNLPRAKMEKEVITGKPEKVKYINLSEEYTDCIWLLPSGEEVHGMGDWELEFDRNGVYDVTLIAFNYHGCSDSITLEHEVLMKGLFFPNTFIPHSKNEKVNRFNGIGMGLRVYCLEIYDQYGNKLWETRALENGMPSEGWDGTNNKGETMPQGMYIWRARAIFGDDDVWTGKNNDSGVEQTVQGSVLLLRE